MTRRHFRTIQIAVVAWAISGLVYALVIDAGFPAVTFCVVVLLAVATFPASVLAPTGPARSAPPREPEWRATARRESHEMGMPFPEADGSLSWPPELIVDRPDDAATHTAIHARRAAAQPEIADLGFTLSEEAYDRLRHKARAGREPTPLTTWGDAVELTSVDEMWVELYGEPRESRQPPTRLGEHGDTYAWKPAADPRVISCHRCGAALSIAAGVCLSCGQERFRD